MSQDRLTLSIGDKAYYDSFNGLIPCKVINIVGTDGPASTNQDVTLKVTAKRNHLYSYGELLDTNGLHAVPRQAVHVKNGRFLIRQYDVRAEYGR